MANTSERTLRLLSLLQTHRYWPGGDLADRLGVSERTLRRDVDRLRELGYPVDASRGVAGGYQLRSGTVMPPLLLDDEEAVAIAVGLRTAAGGAVEGIEETSVRALTKVIQVMPPRLRRRVEALRSYTVPGVFTSGPVVDAQALAVIASACRDDERLRFDYTARGAERTTRLVEPHRLVSLGRRWYLVAWDTERGDWRTFRVDRLVDPRPTGARFRQRELPADDAAAFVKRRLNERPHRYTIEVVVNAPENAVRMAFGREADVTETEPGVCRVAIRSDYLEWPVASLGWLGGEFEVIGPPEFIELVRATGERYVRAVSRQPRVVG
ncbi:helix-turn-helix transcriptional regulator [Cryptosporangium aurantiacum]|uniref:Predicted DNA-binding transcriptional regulator YafY, contains an HTH and WYL domains n=1 Tax=Cryptosporangium aurantiacum TaxID=134849 RepID=A0A1M7MCG6_9ACTN|nr:YafY family protein [Cryptosporangium aurantiacum]SHM88016.1 Predicted DNA-binding transcriptional regulator YafY, contains an HTH and WYL domains [Cryptosporangium aurantiacum]